MISHFFLHRGKSRNETSSAQPDLEGIAEIIGGGDLPFTGMREKPESVGSDFIHDWSVIEFGQRDLRQEGEIEGQFARFPAVFHDFQGKERHLTLIGDLRVIRLALLLIEKKVHVPVWDFIQKRK